MAGKKVEALSPAIKKKYCSGTGKAMPPMQYLKPEMYNAVQDLSKHMHEAIKDHYKAMLCELKYSVDTDDQGLVLIMPNRKRDAAKVTNLSYADAWTRTMPRSLKTGVASGHKVYLEGVPEMFKSSTERTVPLSTTEAETY